MGDSNNIPSKKVLSIHPPWNFFLSPGETCQDLSSRSPQSSWHFSMSTMKAHRSFHQMFVLLQSSIVGFVKPTRASFWVFWKKFKYIQFTALMDWRCWPPLAWEKQTPQLDLGCFLFGSRRNDQKTKPFIGEIFAASVWWLDTVCAHVTSKWVDFKMQNLKEHVQKQANNIWTNTC